MEGFIAILGFWIFMLALVAKKPVMTYLEKSKFQDKEGQALFDRVQQVTERLENLERAVSSVVQGMLEVQQASDFKQMTAARQQNSQASDVQLVDVTPEATSNLLNYADIDPADLGKIIDGNALQIQRLLPADKEQVWKYLTQPGLVASWLAVATIEAKVGGRIELNFDNDGVPGLKGQGRSKIRGLIDKFEPEKSLSFSSIDTTSNLESHISFELENQGEQTLLTVTHMRVQRDRMHEFMAGWHAHLDTLLARLSNMVPPNYIKRFRELIPIYTVAVAAAVIASTTPAIASQQTDDRYQAIKAERSHLLTRYDHLWKDADDLQHEIVMLKRDDSPEVKHAVDSLDRQLQDEYRELHQLEFQIRDLDNALIQ